MDRERFASLTREAWQEGEKRRAHVIPKELTPEEAVEHFAIISRSALLSVAFKVGNHYRQKERLPPLPVMRVPQPINDWIEDSVAALDAASGSVASQSYQSLANRLLPMLHGYETWFRSLRDD